ncbi:hypothetical protein PPYR_03649 [Photinus pyralis]|uniref:Hexosyltransferase n=1 Tax=Photinus pyralis TaxID=7054 RepID=A0A5N4A3K4_PHOPY|nr:chondroitin sulfate synthase 2 [Photinus pyralis]KAB0791849.1 hypothetical protein PPYR_03649 [Photinus pyralis]
MILLKLSRKMISSNFYLLLGILLGVCISCYLDSTCRPYRDPKLKEETLDLQPVTRKRISQKIIHSNKPPTSSKEPEKLVRPHYISTELSIRDKLFVGVLTSEDKINTQAVYINKTVTHLVDKVKFFITVHNKMRHTFNLTGIVGFTDSRSRYRPFQMIKYVGDTFMQGYDYYFFMNDFNYLNVRELKQLVGKVSASNDVYLGTPVDDGSYCNLDAGILISNSVLRALRANLDWCINNAVSDDSSENLGRCVYYSTKLECQASVKGRFLSSYKLKHFQLEKHLQPLSKRKEFNRAVVVYPILQAKDFHILNAYFSRRRLEELQSEIADLSKGLNGTWPPGQRVAAKPATRFDVLPQLYFNSTHLFFPDDFTNIRPHTTADYLDVQKVIKAITDKVLYDNSETFQYRRLVNGYRRFDLSRGMDYTIDLGFRNLQTGKEVIKRFEVCKPLGKVEFVPAPYVTENVRATILLPVEETDGDLAQEFLNNYEKVIMRRRDKVMLMLVLMYQSSSPSKGNSDIFATLKQRATKLSNKYHSDEMRIVWVSIRLPAVNGTMTLGNCKVLNFAMVDLAMRKIGTDALVLVLDVHADFTPEFLNRVRMNTISNFQVFSPIPFRQYNPNVTHADALDVKKTVGHFDRDEYKYIAFYGKDYVTARKKAQDEIPIVRTDNDIAKIVGNTHSGNIYELFLKYLENIHCMRATEKDLRVKYHEDMSNGDRSNLFVGTKLQLAKIILDFQNVIDVIYK